MNELSKETKAYINDKVQKHYHAVVKHMGSQNSVLGVFAYGSMNYGTFQPGQSDVDTKAIIVPSFDDCLFNKPISKELQIEDGHCEIKDIREMFRIYQKQSQNFIETLFTQYYYINPFYKSIWKELQQNNEKIARYNEDLCIQSATNQALHTFYQIRDHSWDGKKYANVLRLIDFIRLYSWYRVNYYQCLIPLRQDLVTKVKYSIEPCLTDEQIKEAHDILIKYRDRDEDLYMRVNRKKDLFVEELLRDLSKTAIIHRMLY